jgi:hypothetical protein
MSILVLPSVLKLPICVNVRIWLGAVIVRANYSVSVDRSPI